MPDQQGSYCQLYRPGASEGIQSRIKKKEFRYDPKRDPRNVGDTVKEVKVNLPKPPPVQVTYFMWTVSY